MVVNRDTLLKDLKNNVIEVFFNNSNPPVRVTLNPKLLPQTFLSDPEQIKEMDEYHNQYKNYIGAWHVEKRGWTFFDINTVTYTQGLEDIY